MYLIVRMSFAFFDSIMISNGMRCRPSTVVTAKLQLVGVIIGIFFERRLYHRHHPLTSLLAILSLLNYVYNIMTG